MYALIFKRAKKRDILAGGTKPPGLVTLTTTTIRLRWRMLLGALNLWRYWKVSAFLHLLFISFEKIRSICIEAFRC